MLTIPVLLNYIAFNNSNNKNKYLNVSIKKKKEPVSTELRKKGKSSLGSRCGPIFNDQNWA